MDNSTSVELECARTIPYEADILSFLKRSLSQPQSRPTLPRSKRFTTRQDEIVAAIFDTPLYVRVEAPAWVRTPEASFVKTLRKYFRREIVAVMRTGQNSYTLILL